MKPQTITRLLVILLILAAFFIGFATRGLVQEPCEDVFYIEPEPFNEISIDTITDLKDTLIFLGDSLIECWRIEIDFR